MPFLFVWTAMLFIPLAMSTGVVGFVQYLGYLAPDLGQTPGDLIGLGIIALVVLLLWRGIENIARITAVMWVVMIASVALVIAAAATDFSPHLAFNYPASAFELTSGHFWVGFAAGLTIGIYDYLGYNTTAYMGAEIKDPGRTLPRSIIYSVLGIMVIYLLLQIGTLGVIDWKRMLDPNDIASTSVASAVLEKAWGKGAADVVTVLILVTAFASVFTGLLGGSRVPYDAARDRVFFRPYAKLHPRHRFPMVGLATMGVVTAVGFLIEQAHRSGHPHPAPHHGDGHRAGARPDPRGHRAAQAPARPAPPLPDVALPAAEPDRAGGLARHLRVRRQELARPPPHRMVAGLAGARLCRLLPVGAGREGLAVRAARDTRGVPGGFGHADAACLRGGRGRAGARPRTRQMEQLPPRRRMHRRPPPEFRAGADSCDSRPTCGPRCPPP